MMYVCMFLMSIFSGGGDGNNVNIVVVVDIHFVQSFHKIYSSFSCLYQKLRSLPLICSFYPPFHVFVSMFVVPTKWTQMDVHNCNLRVQSIDSLLQYSSYIVDTTYFLI